MKIGELSKHTDCPVETIRYYERAGLMPAPPRSEGNYRHYDSAAQARLAFIRRCRSLDMSLDEVRTLLMLADSGTGDCRTADAVIDIHLTHVDERLRELHALQRQLLELRTACNTPGNAENCGILKQLRTHDGATAQGTGHLAGVHGSPILSTPARKRRKA